MVEQLAVNQLVAGSSPARGGAIISHCHDGGDVFAVIPKSAQEIT